MKKIKKMFFKLNQPQSRRTFISIQFIEIQNSYFNNILIKKNLSLWLSTSVGILKVFALSSPLCN